MVWKHGILTSGFVKCRYYDYQLTMVWQKSGDQVYIQLVLLWHATGSVSSGNLSAFHHPKPVLSIRAVSRPKQLATGQCLAVYLCLTLLLIFVINLKIRKRSNKRDICAHQTCHSLVVETKVHFRSFKCLYLSHAQWKLIEGLWNTCDISSKKPA